MQEDHTIKYKLWIDAYQKHLQKEGFVNTLSEYDAWCIATQIVVSRNKLDIKPYVPNKYNNKYQSDSIKLIKFLNMLSSEKGIKCIKSNAVFACNIYHLFIELEKKVITVRS